MDMMEKINIQYMRFRWNEFVCLVRGMRDGWQFGEEQVRRDSALCLQKTHIRSPFDLFQ